MGATKAVVARSLLLTVAMTVGALALGTVLHLLRERGLQLPGAGLAAVSLLGVGVELGIAPDIFPDSPWRIPQQWAAAGSTGYTAIFGVILGTGLVTARTSVGYPVLIAATLTLPSPSAAVLLLGTFGFMRGLATLPVALSHQKFAVLDRLSRNADRLRICEATLLAGIAALSLAQAL